MSDGPLTEVHIGNGAVVPLEQDGGLGTTESALKPKRARARKTRGRCDTCRERNVAVSYRSSTRLSEYKLTFAFFSAQRSIPAALSVSTLGLIVCTYHQSHEEGQESRQKWLLKMMSPTP